MDKGPRWRAIQNQHMPYPWLHGKKKALIFAGFGRSGQAQAPQEMAGLTGLSAIKAQTTSGKLCYSKDKPDSALAQIHLLCPFCSKVIPIRHPFFFSFFGCEPFGIHKALFLERPDKHFIYILCLQSPLKKLGPCS